MTAYQVVAMVLLVGGIAPALWLGASGSDLERLIGLELACAVATVLLVLLAQIAALSYELIVPLVFVPLSFAGTLVYTRLLASEPEPGRGGEPGAEGGEGNSRRAA